ncbi:MAG: Fic family protein, partial [candidate division Zixibacteria bacterium]|nr:Fic family protein [candidate division Zixibacteria bacterium]
ITACNQIADRLLKGESADLIVADIKNFNRLVLEGLPLEEGTKPGMIRHRSAVVGSYRGAPPEDCEYLLQRLCEWLNGEDFRKAENQSTAFSLLKAIMAHLYLAWIHPFGDGNGRTARLVELQILVAAGVPKPAAHLFSNHYNQTRQEYYRQLDRASKSGGDVLPFIEYALSGFLDGLKVQLKTIREQQWDVAWENYVHEEFRDKTSKANVRRRHLVLDLSNLDKPVPLSKLQEITPRMARYYATKTLKTISRDVNVLVKMDLVEKTSEGARPKRETVLAFLPGRRIISSGQGS